MAYTKVSGLGFLTGVIQDETLFYIVQNGESKKITYKELKDYLKGLDNAGLWGSINPQTQTENLQNGFYIAETSGKYNNAGGIVVQEGYYTILEKYSGGWKKSTEVKMPMQDLTALENKNGGDVKIGDNRNVEGKKVFHYVHNESITKFNPNAYVFGYPKDALVIHGNTIYASKVSSNKEIPSETAINWTLIKMSADVDQEFDENSENAIANKAVSVLADVLKYYIPKGYSFLEMQKNSTQGFLLKNNTISPNSNYPEIRSILNFDISHYKDVDYSLLQQSSNNNGTTLLAIRHDNVVVEIVPGLNPPGKKIEGKINPEIYKSISFQYNLELIDDVFVKLYTNEVANKSLSDVIQSIENPLKFFLKDTQEVITWVNVDLPSDEIDDYLINKEWKQFLASGFANGTILKSDINNYESAKYIKMISNDANGGSGIMRLGAFKTSAPTKYTALSTGALIGESVHLIDHTIEGYKYSRFKNDEVFRIQIGFVKEEPYDSTDAVKKYIDSKSITKEDIINVNSFEKKNDYLKNRVLIWEDDFNGNQLDLENWNYLPRHDGNVKVARNSNRSKNVRVEGSNLIITSIKEPYKGKSWSSAQVNTSGKQAFKYGRIEAKIKFSDSFLGIQPAFWLLGDNIDIRVNEINGEAFSNGTYPYCGEVDILEFYGNSNTYESRIHAPNSTPEGISSSAIVTSPNFKFDDYNIFGVEWTEDKIEYYFNNAKFGEVSTKLYEVNGYNAFNQPMHMILNTAIRNNVVTNKNLFTMYVDWVRVYAPIDISNYINPTSVELYDRAVSLYQKSNNDIIIYQGVQFSESLINNSVTIKIGSRKLLSAKTNPINSSNQTYKWYSSDENIFKVERGVIFPIEIGSAKLIVSTENYITKEITVNVIQ